MIELGKVMLASDEQLRKEQLPMVVIELGNVMLVSDEQPEKAPPPP